jgi:hypothetical protein
MIATIKTKDKIKTLTLMSLLINHACALYKGQMQERMQKRKSSVHFFFTSKSETKGQIMANDD